MTNIEPTEEQKQAARDLYNNLLIDFNMGADIRPPEALARLLAEREAKLREQMERLHRAVVDTICDAQDAENNTLRARVAELESEVRIAWADCHDGSCEACAKCVDQAKHQRDFATARVAELERALERTREQRFTNAYLYVQEIEDLNKSLKAANAREAQHLADIKALHQFLGDHEEEEGIWIPRSEFKDVPCRKYLDDAKAAEGGER